MAEIDMLDIVVLRPAPLFICLITHFVTPELKLLLDVLEHIQTSHRRAVSFPRRPRRSEGHRLRRKKTRGHRRSGADMDLEAPSETQSVQDSFGISPEIQKELGSCPEPPNRPERAATVNGHREHRAGHSVAV